MSATAKHGRRRTLREPTEDAEVVDSERESEEEEEEEQVLVRGRGSPEWASLLSQLLSARAGRGGGEPEVRRGRVSVVLVALGKVSARRGRDTRGGWRGGGTRRS